MSKLTAPAVRALRAPGKYADGHGLFLHVVEPNRRYWIFRYQRAGRERVMSLGSADDISLADARTQHAKERAILLAGADPLGERERAREAQRQRTHSFAEVAETCITAHQAGWRAPRNPDHWRQSLRDYVLPRFGAKPVAEVGIEDVLKALRPIWTTKSQTASRLRGRLEVIIDYAIAMGWRDGPNPALWRGGLKSLLPPPTKVHEVEHYAALDWREAPALMAELRERERGMGGLALAFLILTATRNSEVRGAAWSEIDLEQRAWTIPASRMKTGKIHRVPLSESAMDLLRGLVRTELSLVFFGRSPGRPMGRETMKLALARLGHPDITVHGFRSTFRDWCADTGKAADIAEAALAHAAGNAVVQAYARSDLFERRRALMDAWAAYLMQPPAKVVPLRREKGA
jgi:integrase